MKIRTKTFQETRYERRVPGAPPGEWEHVSHSESIDSQILQWIAETGSTIESISSPGISQLWCDQEMSTKCIILAFVVMYYAEITAEDAYDEQVPTPVHD